MLKKIISGGQTGADQGGLRAGLILDLETGGWIPKGFRTDVGEAPWLAELGLAETAQRNYQVRTKLNVENSDGTLVFGNVNSPGCKLTRRFVRELGKPIFVVHWFSGQPIPRDRSRFASWIENNDIVTLNVAGNRESMQPGINEAVFRFLVDALS